MSAHRFDPAKLPKLNDPARFIDLIPERIWDAFGVTDPETVIELGAGTGIFSVEFAKLLGDGVIYAVDSEPLMLQWMAEHLPRELDGIVIPVDADVGSIPLPNGIADLVYSINLHHEVEDAGSVLREAKRLLHPGGVVGIVDWRLEDSKPGPPLAARVGGAAIAQQAEDAGFSDVRMLDVLPRHDIVVGRRIG
ncbi:MAG: methyltransferase domain-containing protein [Coriobacteriia bacterium]|nr:methyltransferase domain-containing protein [Coriobacteriia bacterium]